MKKRKKIRFKYKPKHVQIQRGLVLRIINCSLTEVEYVNGTPVHFVYNLNEIMASLGYDPSVFIPQMLKNGYLVVREKDPLSFYLFSSKKKGQEFRRHLKAA